MPDKSATSPPQAPCCGGLLHKHPSHTMSTIHRPSILKINSLNEANKEYLLSIGRIFHKITLNDSVITVTRYRPR